MQRHHDTAASKSSKVWQGVAGSSRISKFDFSLQRILTAKFLFRGYFEVKKKKKDESPSRYFKYHDNRYIRKSLANSVNLKFTCRGLNCLLGFRNMVLFS